MKNGQIQLEQFSKSWLQIGFSLSLFIFMWWRWKVNQTSRNCTFAILGPGATLGRILLDYLLNCKPLQNLMLKTLSLSTPLFPSGHWTVLDRMSSRFLTGFPQDFVQISLRFLCQTVPSVMVLPKAKSLCSRHQRGPLPRRLTSNKTLSVFGFGPS